MVDIHCHILYGMDDGADSLSESVNMLKTAEENKIDIIVATPHFLNYNKIDDFVIERDEQAQKLAAISEKNNFNLKIYCGAELYLDSRIFSADTLDELTINSTRYMLCEFSLKPFEPTHAMAYIEELTDRGYIPIIAHPERYITFLEHPTLVNELWDMGSRFQVNASSLAGHGGEDMLRLTKDLIARGFVDFLATDAHSSDKRNNKILDKAAEFPSSFSAAALEYMMNKAPLAVLADRDMPQREVNYF